MALALDHCHARGVVHRDVKPANVLIERGSGRPVLVDFGLAKRDRERMAMPTIDQGLRSEPDEVRGTPQFMAPEQVEGEAGPASDVYGLGATLFFLLTGKAPHQGTSALQVISRVLSTPVADPRTLNPVVPAALAALCLRATAIDPALRPASARAFAIELRRSIGSVGRRPPRFAIAASIAVLLLAGVVGAWLVRARVRDDARAPAAEAPVASTAPVDSLAEGLALSSKLEREATTDADWEALRALCDQLIATWPECGKAWRRRAGCHHRLGRYAECEADADRAIRLTPDDPRAWEYRGAARVGPELRGDLVEPERLREALADFDRSLELDPGHAETWRYRAGVKLRLGDFAGAEADFTRLLANALLAHEDSRPWSTHLGRAVARERQGDLAGALEDYEAHLSLAERPSAHARKRVEELRGR